MIYILCGRFELGERLATELGINRGCYRIVKSRSTLIGSRGVGDVIIRERDTFLQHSDWIKIGEHVEACLARGAQLVELSIDKLLGVKRDGR